ncbi:MAG TPA: hypothetical protein PK843_03605 [bacterium]|nr:hypothetical protein [bacterium]
MSFTYQELKGKTVAELRKIASGIEHEAVQGYTQLNKEHLLVAICKALGIDTHAHHHAEIPEKTQIKSEIHLLKKRRQEAIAAKDKARLQRVRGRIHFLKNKLRRKMV